MSIYTDAIAPYGEDSQWRQATEELAELIVAINHHRRGRIPDSALVAEIADVQIMVEQMTSIFRRNPPSNKKAVPFQTWKTK